jgi:hypothetical protein
LAVAASCANFGNVITKFIDTQAQVVSPHQQFLTSATHIGNVNEYLNPAARQKSLPLRRLILVTLTKSI